MTGLGYFFWPSLTNTAPLDARCAKASNMFTVGSLTITTYIIIPYPTNKLLVDEIQDC